MSNWLFPPDTDVLLLVPSGYRNNKIMLVISAEEGDRSPARYISCNGCCKPGLKEGGIYCVVEKKEKAKDI